MLTYKSLKFQSKLSIIAKVYHKLIVQTIFFAIIIDGHS